jgi:hypothetical protein
MVEVFNHLNVKVSCIGNHDFVKFVGLNHTLGFWSVKTKITNRKDKLPMDFE